MPKKSSAASRKGFLAKLEEHLVDIRAELFTEIESQLKAQREGNRDAGTDTFDVASEERDREINFILSGRDQAKIKQINDALKGLRENSYGGCESCGLEIAVERLQAMPFARLCRDCQQDQERRDKSQNHYRYQRDASDPDEKKI